MTLSTSLQKYTCKKDKIMTFIRVGLNTGNYTTADAILLLVYTTEINAMNVKVLTSFQPSWHQYKQGVCKQQSTSRTTWDLENKSSTPHCACNYPYSMISLHTNNMLTGQHHTKNAQHYANIIAEFDVQTFGQRQ